MTFQAMVAALNEYWAGQGCAILPPYDLEVGAGTMHPATTLRALGPEPWNVAYLQPSRRPADGRYGLNPQRSQRYYQYQVLMKPSPTDIVDRYLGSLDALGFDTAKNDVRFVEDDWESQAAGASGVGWEVWVNGAEITQFTFFQQMGGIECKPVCAEITYGPERLCLMLNGGRSFWDDLQWSDGLSYRQAEYALELQHNVYNYEVASVERLQRLFELYEAESAAILADDRRLRWDAEQGTYTLEPGPEGEPPPGAGPPWMVYPALDYALKCSHVFNVLDARGAVGVSLRAGYIARIRRLVRECCKRHVSQYAPAAKA